MRNVKTENPSVRPSAVEEPRRRRGVAETELCHKLDLLLRTGSLLMESAADTSRILRTMKRAMAFLGLDERIRTYNFPQGRVTDHRIGLTLYSLGNFMNGDIGEMVEALRLADQTAKLQAE